MASRDEPDPPYEREAGREWEDIAEAQMRAYLANQEANDEVLARWRWQGEVPELRRADGVGEGL